MSQTIRALDFETLDALLWRANGTAHAAQVQAVLEHRENKHLSQYSSYLPRGTQVYIPDFEQQPEAIQANPTRLWS